MIDHKLKIYFSLNKSTIVVYFLYTKEKKVSYIYIYIFVFTRSNKEKEIEKEKENKFISIRHSFF
jgi:hypothetical protein